MSTIASPRPSLTLSSRRTSTSNDTVTARSPASSRAPVSGRRNRAALRDYYKIPAEALSDAAPGSQSSLANSNADQDDNDTDIAANSEIDGLDFDAAVYVKKLAAEEDIEGLLRAAIRNEREIRTLDGEKKALVYNNYAKLITATDTIREMREKMDPIMPMTENLKEDVGKIADLAEKIQESFAKLAENLEKQSNALG